MLKLITNAIVYKAELPSAQLLAKHLAEFPYHPIADTALSQASFVPNKTSNELVTEFTDGFAFHLRYDEKILPASVVKAKSDERIAKFEAEQGVRLKKAEREAIREQTLVDLAKTALVKTSIIPAFYSTKDNLLIVNTGGKKFADRVTSYLIHAVGSVKTTTIHVSNIKHGLTTRLKSHLWRDDNAFDGFEVGASVALKSGSQKVSYSLEDLETARAGILEAIDKGFEVERLAMVHHGVEFKLTSDFHFKAVRFEDSEREDDDEVTDAVHFWKHEAGVQVLQFSAALNQLCDLLGYKAEEEAEAEQTA